MQVASQPGPILRTEIKQILFHHLHTFSWAGASFVDEFITDLGVLHRCLGAPQVQIKLRLLRLDFILDCGTLAEQKVLGGVALVKLPLCR